MRILNYFKIRRAKKKLIQSMENMNALQKSGNVGHAIIQSGISLELIKEIQELKRKNIKK